MNIKINGTDISSLIAVNGVRWSVNDVDGPDAGRTLDAKMWRNRIASKVKLEVSCKPLNLTQLGQVLNLLSPEYVTVEYFDPMTGQNEVKEMYSSTRKAAFMYKVGNVEMWEDVSFSLIER